MPINHQKLGPGQLTLGAPGPMEVQAQLTSCKVVPAETVSTKEARKVLSGEELAAEDSATYSFTLQGTMLQDSGAAASLSDWSWTNMGTEQAFIFVPNDVAARQCSGVLTPVPLQFGGDEMDADMTADFTWRIKGTPDLDDVP